MPLTIPAAAFAPMLTDAITATAYTRASGALRADTVEIAAACVSAPQTDPATVGDAVDAWQYAVEFPLAAWTVADNPPAPGTIIDAGARWPKLYVQQAVPLGALWHLTCSTREGY